MSQASLLDNPGESRSLWRNVSFLLMWSSVAASGFGDRLIQLAAEPMLGVYHQDAPAARITASIMFFFFLPYMVLTVAGGWLADRLPRKWIMLACDECRAAVLLIAFFMAAGLGTAVAIAPEHHWKVYLVMLATGAFAAIFNPSKQSTLPQIVPAHHLQPANAVLAGIALIASLIGLQVGGPIVEKVSIRMGILIGVLSFGISGFFFAFLKVVSHKTAGRSKRSSLAAQMSAALTYMRRHRPVYNLVVLNIIFWSAAWVVNAAIAALNKNYYGIASENYLTAKSTMLALLGVGMLGGSAVVLWIGTRRESGVIAMAALVLAALCMLAMAMIHMYQAALVLAFGVGLFGGIFLICVDTLTQSLTPNYLRGRVFGLRALLNTFSAVVVNFVIWRSSDADTYMVGALGATAGATGLVAVVGWWRLMRSGPSPRGALNMLWRMNRLYALIWHRLHWTGRENIPAAGPVILAANHTAGVDPALLQAMIPRRVRWVMLRKHRLPMLAWLWRTLEPIALDRDRSNLACMRHMLKVLEQREVLGMFPEGRLQRDRRKLGDFQPGIGLLAVKSKALIVPIWISDTPRTRHMFWHFFWPSRARLIVGAAFAADDSMRPQEVADELRRRLLELGDKVKR